MSVRERHRWRKILERQERRIVEELGLGEGELPDRRDR